MEYAVLGWPDDGPTLRLDHREFAYAGKFVMSNTGKAVCRETAEPSRNERAASAASRDGGELIGAVSFNADRTDDDAAWLRYVTVRRDRRGDGVGARLAAFAIRRLHDRGYRVVRIAVNNPFAYHALYKAGFGFIGDETGIAELVLAHPASDDADYGAGLDRFRARDGLSDAEESFLAAKAGAGPPETVDVPE
jgi:GNAT superfamily N-acetyltransferase